MQSDLKRITELEQQETEFHARLHPQVRSVLKGKNLLIWRGLLVETGYPDLEIFDEVTDGIRLVGPACESGIILRADGTFSLDNQTRPGGLVC